MGERLSHTTALALAVTLSTEWLSEFVGDVALTVGPALASAVDDYTRTCRIGYYPALGYLAGTDAIDADLLAAMDEVANVVREHSYRAARRHLRAVFPNVRFESIQLPAYMLPDIRPRKPNAVALLARHYTPDTVKFNLLVTQPVNGTGSGAGDAIAQQAVEALRKHFAGVSLISVRPA